MSAFAETHCYECGGRMALGIPSGTTRWRGMTLSHPRVPVMLCSTCGEHLINYDMAERIDHAMVAPYHRARRKRRACLRRWARWQWRFWRESPGRHYPRRAQPPVPEYWTHAFVGPRPLLSKSAQNYNSAHGYVRKVQYDG